MENGYRSETSRSGVAGCVGYACLLGASKSLRFDALTQANHAFGGTKNCPPPLNSPLAVKSQPFAEHGHVRLFVKPSSYEFLGAFFSKGRPFSIWLSTQFSRGCRGPPASGDAFSRGIEMACYVTPPVQCRWRCGERGLFDAKSVRLRISSKTECVARFPVAFPFHFAGCFFELGKRWSSSLPRCGNPPLSLRGSNLADFVPKGMRSAKGCACVEWATERSFGLSAVLACELASRQKLFWRRYRKGFVTPAFTPCL